ncbi:hypothetical protein FHS00_001630 [Limimaricola variabilis]|uniref:Uncharacterized protein n=1 Tax=Limimaricola variabilis TaxID=1492771 RepID=A0ABR6HNB6_9RHOB|nr:hypothetical protein [Limimaricola variabilis]MBB3712053.1 hypothetical protein [Limimaricola variabilis]WPY93119.1 hypothetical protein T8T21_08260 [Limimaricola variabilis]
MSKPLRRIPTTRGVLAPPDPFGAFGWTSWGSVLAGAVIGLALMLPLMLLWRGLAGVLPGPAGFWSALLPLPALWAAGWAAATLSGAPRRRIAALHGICAWALLAMVVTAATVFAPALIDRAVPEFRGLAAAPKNDLVLGVLALAGLFAAALGGSLGGPAAED